MNKLEYAIRLILDNNDTIWYHQGKSLFLVVGIDRKGIRCICPFEAPIYLDKNRQFKIEEVNRNQCGATYNLVKKKSPKKIRRLR